jgi:hypothetical protein
MSPKAPVPTGRGGARQAWESIQAGRFTEAATLLAEADPLDTAAAMPARLARNLAAMQQHRPRTLRRLVQAGLLEAVNQRPLQVTPSGQPVPSKVRKDGTVKILAAGPDPRAAAEAALTRGHDAFETGEPIAVVELADGHLLSALAARPKPASLVLSMQQGVDLVETDVHLVTVCLMLHEWAGADGPIADPRFGWFVGPDAVKQYADRFAHDPMLRPPQVVLGRESRRQTLREALSAATAKMDEQAQRWRRRVDEHYADYDCRPLTVGTTNRPRVLLMTSRFTTVLKYSTADCEQAFAKLGWRTRTLIEPTDTHRMTTTAVTQALATFRPDLVFSIDHLRCHSGAGIPAKLPYVCWIQDQLPKLTCPEAGASVTDRDFVLSMVGPMYTRQWGYPARQMIDVPKLTRPPVRPAKWDSLGHDLTYVSSASQQPETMLQPFAHDPLLAEAAKRVVEVYERGDALPTMGHVGQVLDGACRDLGRGLSMPDRAKCVNHLCLPLNNALYRQQALRWVARVADDLDLDLALYGPGWDQHPDFAQYAKGPVEYGPALEQLTRDSKINLQIIPSFCLHQRLLDGLVAGGFFLVRQHPTDVLMPRLLELLDDQSQTVEEALANAGPKRAALEKLFEEAKCLTDLGMPIDLVEWLRCGQRGELLNTSGRALPRLDKVSFADEASLRQRIERFVKDPAARRRVAAQQRENVVHRLSYTAGLRRALARIGRLLTESTTALGSMPPARTPEDSHAAA